MVHSFRQAVRCLALAALAVCCARSGALASVLPQAKIDAALASTKSIHRLAKTYNGVPQYSVDGANYTGILDTDSLDYGFLSNGTDVLIVPLGSGGSGGVFYTLLFTSVDTKPYYIGYVPAADTGHLQVFIQEGRLVVKTPIYKANDPNCCPRSHHIIVYTIVDRKLKQVDEYDEDGS